MEKPDVMTTNPDKFLERIFQFLEVMIWVCVIAGISIGYAAWRRTYG